MRYFVLLLAIVFAACKTEEDEPGGPPYIWSVTATPQCILVGDTVTLTAVADGGECRWIAPEGTTLSGSGWTVSAVVSESGFFYFQVIAQNRDYADTAGVYVVVSMRQAPQILWQSYLPGNGDALYASQAALMSDGGFAVVANVSNYYLPYTGVLIRTDADGQQLWYHEGQMWYSYYRDVVATDDGGCILVGSDMPEDTVLGSGPYFARFDAEGNRIWHRRIGDSMRSNSLLKTDDSTYVALTSSWSDSTQGLLWFTCEGDSLHSITQIGPQGQIVLDFELAADGDLLVATRGDSQYEMTLTRIGWSGEIRWSRLYIDQHYFGADICGTPDNGIAVACEENLILLNANGDVQFTSHNLHGVVWTPMYSGEIHADAAGFVIGGSQYMVGFGAYVSRLDTQGQLVWITGFESNLGGISTLLDLPDGSIVGMNSLTGMIKLAPDTGL